MMGLIAIGCSDEPAATPSPDAGQSEPAWQVVLDEASLDRAVLSVWAAAPDAVFVAGGPLGHEGYEALALRYDGERWRDLAPGGADGYWWVSGSSATDVWMVGENGRITRYDGESTIEHDSGTTATLWGVYAFGEDDAWAVGGTPEGGVGEPNDVLLRWDGASWSPEALPGEPLGRALYKVWGTSSSDLYVVGELGTIWHRVGSEWSLESDPPIAAGTLFTVHGCGAGDAAEIYAVGGRDVLRREDGTWKAIDLELTNDVNGVGCEAPGSVAIVGFGGLKRRLVDGEWVDDFREVPHADLHATWPDGAGSFWAVGGNFLTKPSASPRAGVVARYGPGLAGDEIE
jgi:hypothetical protein